MEFPPQGDPSILLYHEANEDLSVLSLLLVYAVLKGMLFCLTVLNCFCSV